MKRGTTRLDATINSRSGTSWRATASAIGRSRSILPKCGPSTRDAASSESMAIAAMGNASTTFLGVRE